MLQRSHIVTGDEGHYVATIQELEPAAPCDSGVLRWSGFLQTGEQLLLPTTLNSHRGLSCVLTGFALVGGPPRQDHPKAIER